MKIVNLTISLSVIHRYGNTLRFPGAADEPPCPGKGYADVARKGRF